MFIAAAAAFAAFTSLGIWQVKRLAWKEALIAQVERNVHGAPAMGPGPAAWMSLKREADEYRRLSVRGQFAHDQETLVRASTELGGGYWVLTPLRTEQGFWVWVNRGFVPPEWREPSKRRATEPTGEQTVVGLLRWSEPGGSALQKNDGTQGRWYSRDVLAMAAAQGLAGQPVAPYFIDVAAPDQPASRPASTVTPTWPRPGLTVLRFTNNHLVYALTWFALAAMTAGALGYVVADERRLRRLADKRASHAEPARH
ncbi:MAG: SURF1 family protein [Burkholderiales bacterium]|nr:SURF1 family protein [Burkholderiales bacterium]